MPRKEEEGGDKIPEPRGKGLEGSDFIGNQPALHSFGPLEAYSRLWPTVLGRESEQGQCALGVVAGGGSGVHFS